MMNLPSCKIFCAVLILKSHLSSWFINCSTVFKHRFLKKEIKKTKNNFIKYVHVYGLLCYKSFSDIEKK